MPNPFATPGMAAGYAQARPPVHERILERASRHLKGVPFRRGLDVGSGSGISTRALASLAQQCTGIEPAEAMVRLAPTVAQGAQFLVGAAEHLPFASGSFDVIAAAGSLNYVDLALFFPGALRVLTPAGVLVVYDFATGRSFRESPRLDEWFTDFTARYPWPAGEARRIDPDLLREMDTGFAVAADEQFQVAQPLTRDAYLRYVLTETNVARAVRDGVPLEDVESWCAKSLESVWPKGSAEVLFRAYFACLKPIESPRSGTR